MASFDSWLLDVLVQLARRNVIDCSEAVDMLHYDTGPVGTDWGSDAALARSRTYVNRYLAFHEPKLSRSALNRLQTADKWMIHLSGLGTSYDAPYAMVKDA